MGRVKKSERTKDNILKCAIALFAAKGLEGVSLREVAGDAGVPISTLMYYFSSKQGLQEEAITRAADILSSQLNAATARSDDPRENLRNWIENGVSYFFRQTTEARLLDREVWSRPPGAASVPGVTALRNGIWNRSGTEIIERIRPGRLDGISARRMRDFIISMLYGLARLRTVHSYDTPAHELTSEEISRVTYDLVLRSLESEPAGPQLSAAQRYYLALGRVTQGFCDVQELVAMALLGITGMELAIARDLLTQDRLAGTCELLANTAPVPWPRDVFVRLASLARLRDAMTQIRPRVETPNLISIGQIDARSCRTIAELAQLENMAKDLQTAACALMLSWPEDIFSAAQSPVLQECAKRDWFVPGGDAAALAAQQTEKIDTRENKPIC